MDPDALDAEDALAAGAVAAGAVGVVGLHAGASGGKAPTTPPTSTNPAAPATPTTPGSPNASTPNTAGTSTTPTTPVPGTPEANSPDAQQTNTDGNTTERTTPEIDAALTATNPNFDPFDPANGYATNCGNTSSILNDFLNGNPTREAPTGTLDVPQMEARTGNPQTPMTPDQIADSLRAMGPGSHCVVGIDRSTGDGHWFNAYFDGTTVWSIDAQTGTRSPWPPNEPNATNWDASIRPENVVAPVIPTAAEGTPRAEADAAGSRGDASAPESTRGSTAASSPRFDPSIAGTLSPESRAILADAEADGRDLTPTELDALNADPAVRDAVDANSDVRRRVRLRVRVMRDIISQARRNRDGDFVTEPNRTIVPCLRYPDNTPMRFDPATGRLVPPGSPGITMPVRERFDFGHRPAYQWRDTRIVATLESGWSRRDVIEHENVPGHYRIEDFSENRSNRYNRTP